MGLLGQSFQVHGIDGSVYNLIVDRDMVVNARFRYLSSGRCPTVTMPSNCWSHPGSYLGEIGVVSTRDSMLHVSSGGWDRGFKSVVLNNVTLSVGTNATVDGIELSFLSSYLLSLKVGNFQLVMENSDHFINILETHVLQWHKLSSHGLLGQTWRMPSRPGNQVRCIEGDIDDYLERNNDLLGFDFVYGVGGLVD